jgi:hypothetical protein
MQVNNHKDRVAGQHELKVLVATRDTIRNLLSGVLLLFLSISIIIIQNRQELISLFLDKQISYREILPVVIFIFACCHIWYYTCKAAKIMKRRLQLWIGSVRAVVLVGFVLIIMDYLV